MSSSDKIALNSLLHDKSLIVKESDKGGAVVCMDSDYYRDAVTGMLNDDNFYGETNDQMDNGTRDLIKAIVENHGADLYEEEINYLTNFEHSTSYFYGLLKIHKSEIITRAVEEQKSEYVVIHRPNDLKFRPIVGGPNSATQRLSHFLDLVLKPLCKEVPSFIRDDIDFLNCLPDRVDAGSKLVTFDVINLYTNIPHNLGLEAVAFWLEKASGKIDCRFSHAFILESLELILNRNVFYFDGKYYIQKKGTAMGSKVAPTYATLVLGYLEEKLFKTMEDKHGSEISNYLRINWKRFLDDCFIIWNNNLTTDEFFQEINSLHPPIQFTKNESDTNIAFLDVLVKLIGNRITTDLYCKSTDTHNYLNFGSCHPKHTKINIPFSLASRVVTIVKDKELQKKRLSELHIQLRKQDYPEEVIRNGIERAKSKGPIKPTDRNNEASTSVIPFVTTYNPRNTNMLPAVRACEVLLNKSQTMSHILQEKKIMNSKRQPKSLKRILSHSRFDFEEGNLCVKKCGKPRCKTCPHIIEGEAVTFKNGKTFKVKHNMTCTSRNLIYAIICDKCRAFYIGQTSNELRNRMTLHRQQTNTAEYRLLKVNKHLHECANGNFQVFPIYKIFSQDASFREEKELYFIRTLQSDLNSSV